MMLRHTHPLLVPLAILVLLAILIAITGQIPPLSICQR